MNKSIKYKLEAANKSMKKKEWSNASKAYQEIMNILGDESPSNVFLQLTRAYRMHKDYENANMVAEKGIKKYPDNIDLSCEYAEIATAKEDWLIAIERWNEIIDNYGDKAPARAYYLLSAAYCILILVVVVLIR